LANLVGQIYLRGVIYLELMVCHMKPVNVLVVVVTVVVASAFAVVAIRRPIPSE